MKNLKILPFLLLLVFSCTEEDNPVSTIENSTGENEVKIVSVTTTDYKSDEAANTRGLTYDGVKTVFAWTEKDTLGIFPDKGDQMPFAFSDGVGTNNAIVDGGGWALKKTSVYTAYSPFNRKNYYRDRQHILLDYTGQVENGIANADHLGAFDFQATVDTKAVNDHLSFQMERLNCVWILRLTIPQMGSYKRIKVSAGSPIFTTEANLSLGGQYVYTPVKMSAQVTLDLQNVTTTEDNQVADFLMMLGPVDMTGQSITVSLLGANGYEYKATRTLSSNFAAGSLKRSAFELVIDDSANVGIGGEFETKEEPI